MDGDGETDVGPCDDNGGRVLVITMVVMDGVCADVSSTGSKDTVPADNVAVGRSVVPIAGSSVRAKDTLRGSIKTGSLEVDTAVGGWEDCDVTAKF